jgi:hypothetical protein
MEKEFITDDYVLKEKETGMERWNGSEKIMDALM